MGKGAVQDFSALPIWGPLCWPGFVEERMPGASGKPGVSRSSNGLLRRRGKKREDISVKWHTARFWSRVDLAQPHQAKTETFHWKGSSPPPTPFLNPGFLLNTRRLTVQTHHNTIPRLRRPTPRVASFLPAAAEMLHSHITESGPYANQWETQNGTEGTLRGIMVSRSERIFFGDK